MTIQTQRSATSRKALPWQSPVEVLAHHAASRPNALAIAYLPHLQDVARELSYAALQRRVLAVAAALQACTELGERALLVLDNDPDYAIAFLACARAGRVAVTLNTPTQKKQLARLLHVARDAEARLILTTRALADRYRARIEAAADGQPVAWLLVDEVAEELAERYQPHQPAAADLAFLQYTSGSTGTPRGVMVRHADLVYQGEYIQGLLSLTQQDRALSWLPLFHDMGLILGLLQPLYTGFPLYLSSPGAFIKNPERWLKAIATYGITLSGGPDFAYDLCCDVVEPASLAGIDLSRWELAFNGAEPVRARTLDRFTQRFAGLNFRPESCNPCYGLAEATLGVTATPRGTRHRRRWVAAQAFAAGRAEVPLAGGEGREVVSSGRWLPDTVVRIVDLEHAEALGPDRVGEVWIGGSGPALGYWRQPEATEAGFAGRLPGDDARYLRTGDVGFVDTDGHLYITGRTKDLIVVAGKNHYPSDIEQTVEAASEALRPHFAVAFAVEHDERERLVVMAEVKPQALGALDVEALGREVMRRVLAEHEIPVDEVVLLRSGQLPKTTSGKLQRGQCRQAWADGAFERLGVVRRAVKA